MSATLFRNARIFSPEDSGRPLAGPRQGRVASYDTGALLCRNGLIEAVGPEREVLAAARDGGRAGSRAKGAVHEVDCGGRCMIPGFVDPHTHLCFVEPRETEFLLRLDGVPYLDILAGGGGILATVVSVRAASEADLAEATRKRALACLRLGTTTIEIKSGYGLSTEAELKQLRAAAAAGRSTPLTVVTTLLGAHAIPPEFAGDAEGYVDLLAAETVPAAARAGLARYCDAFCERGVFTPAQCRRVLEAARRAGLGVKVHADEVHDTGGAALAASLGAVSAEHLLRAGEAGLAALAAAGSVAVLLPATAWALRTPYAPARRMVELGLPVAIATDCNPGSSYTESMPFVFGLGVLGMGLSVNEALVASTLNAAYAIGEGAAAGSLSPGKRADLLLLDGETPGILAFHAGVSAVTAVYAKGVRAWPAKGSHP
jgi:imidazolonepropionase